jgi:hypothetical protein
MSILPPKKVRVNRFDENQGVTVEKRVRQGHAIQCLYPSIFLNLSNSVQMINIDFHK